jgi:hypothetical protein
MGSAGKVVDVDKGWKAILKSARAVGGKRYAKVGVLADGKGEGKEGEGPLTIAEIAAILELGTEDRKIPARSFIGSTFDEQRAALEQMATELVIEVVLYGLDSDVALNRLGAKLAAEVKKKITAGQGIPPPNAPSTAMAKARTGQTSRLFKRQPKGLGDALAQVGALAAVRTLVDTGRMLGAITWAVVEKEE